MRFAPEYVTHVLNENFEDAKRLFVGPLLAIHYAHLVMLAETRIITPDTAGRVRRALDIVSREDVCGIRYDGTYEDFFFYIDRQIVREAGEDAAGRLHTARSRNDIAMTMYRMRLREFVLGLSMASLDLRRSLVDLAVRHCDTVFLVHTHTQRAQPTTVAHYVLAVIEQLERDADRLRASYERTNRSPLGACAITGTGFPIDRALTADLLGFDGPTVNTYGSIATVDYLLESVSSASVLLTGLGRFTQDLLLWSTAEFDYLRLGDGFVQTSSIMPQKRNPVALEHARSIGSKAVGQAHAVVVAVHNTPFGDIVDTEDDLQPLVFTMFRDGTRAVKLLAAALATATFDAEALEGRAGEGWSTLTELADRLVRDHDVPFTTAHRIAAGLMEARNRDPRAPLSRVLAEVSEGIHGTALRYSEAALAEALSPRNFVQVRRTLGGPAPEEVARATTSARATLESDQAWWDGRTAHLAQAQQRLADRCARL